jgi:DNA-3-methyladenine glycosylase
LEEPPTVVAPLLLNKLMVRGECVARIVEVEAYGDVDDPGSHAGRRRTARNAPMFLPAGHWYVYFSYGMHWCANVVCGAENVAAAVLVRAAVPLSGLESIRRRRTACRADVDLCRGPARLCAALCIDQSINTTSTAGAELTLAEDGVPPPARPGRSTRIGLSAGTDLRWRWFVDRDPHVSRRRT